MILVSNRLISLRIAHIRFKDNFTIDQCHLINNVIQKKIRGGRFIRTAVIKNKIKTYKRMIQKLSQYKLIGQRLLLITVL